MGLPGLIFKKKQTRIKTSENVQDKDDVCRPDDEQDNIIVGCSAQNSTSQLNFITEKHEANQCFSMIRSDSLADDIQQREHLYRGEGPQNVLSSLMSFWESGNKGTEVLSIKKVPAENKVSD